MKTNFIVLILALLFCTTPTISQFKEPNVGEYGTKNKIDFVGELFPCWIEATQKCVYKICDFQIGSDVIKLYCAPAGVDIQYVHVKDYTNLNDDNYRFIITLSNGQVIQVSSQGTNPVSSNINNPNPGEPPQKGAGDDLYAISDDLVWVSRDSNQTWQLDTMGLKGARIYDISLDTFQNVYLSTSLGLFKQPLTSNVWTKINSYPRPSSRVVFVDRKNRIYSYTAFNILYRSTNLGMSFQPDTAGLGNKFIMSLADDAFGNIYAVVQHPFVSGTNGNQIYRSMGGTQPFVRIDQSLNAMNGEPSADKLFIDIAGDTALRISTLYGMFYSVDKGLTWTDGNQGIRSDVVYNYIEGSNGRRFATTNLGMYSIDPADAEWKKNYPATKYINSQRIFRDDAGAIYTQGMKTDPSDFYNSPRHIVKSTDNGETWEADTLGLSKIGMFGWYVDEEGTQYAAEIGLGVSPMKLYKKRIGESWTSDTAGFVTPLTDYPTAWSSDGNGNIYFSTQAGGVWRRSMQRAVWQLDVDGLNDAIFSLASTSDHTMVAGGFQRAHYKNENVWMDMGPNPLAPLATNAFILTVDEDDYVWVGFSHFGPGFNSIGDGVFYTNDFGSTWHPAVGNVDTVTFRQLVPIGDTVYGLSFINGIYLFTRSQVIDSDMDGYNAEDDCNDTIASINPGAIEIPNNTMDENCDGIALVIDDDMDGYNSDDDCNDLVASINPGAIEIPNNKIDENCDGIALIIDDDMDGYNSDDDCNDQVASINPGAVEIPNNDVDENCDGIALIIDDDMDGYNSDEDCNDAVATINPGAIEIPNNGIDEDCDGMDLMVAVDDSHDFKGGLSVSPNPTDGSTELLFSLRIASRIKLFILDLNGKKMAKLFDKNLERGSQAIQFDASGFSNGEYILLLQSKYAAHSVQFVIMK